jgi:hypothetical protein
MNYLTNDLLKEKRNNISKQNVKRKKKVNKNE